MQYRGPRTATSGVRSDEGTEGIHEVNDVGARSREAERGYSASRAVARAFRRTDQSIPGLVPASLSARDADHPRSSRQHARTEPLRYREGSLAAQAVDRRQWSRSAAGRRQLQRSRLPLDGNGRGPLRTQCSDRRHPWRAAPRTIRAQSAAGEPRSARAPQLRAGAASQRARPRLAAIHGARLAEPWRRRHHEPAAQVAAAAGRRLAVFRHDDPAHAAGRPVLPGGPGPARDLSQHRDPLVGRLAALRLRPRAATPGAHRSGERTVASGRKDSPRCTRPPAGRCDRATSRISSSPA